MNASTTSNVKPVAVADAAKPAIQEYSIRVPKNSKKKHNVMRFNATLNVDFTKWSQVKMERENNMKEYKNMDEDMPKFGAGSEFGRDAREEARRKKYGITSRRYKPEHQPWILKSGGKTGKKFKGTREGGVSENAAYYVFTHATDGAIEAFPLHEWYNFQPIQRYKTLSSEEAEEEFSRRNRVMNYFSLMLRKRLRNDEEGGDEEGEMVDGIKGKKKPTKKDKELLISEMDEWMDSDDDELDDSEDDKKKSDEEDSKNKSNGQKKKDAQSKNKSKQQKKKKKKKNSDDEAFEESDDGDEEGRERDYISDSSESETELEQQKEIKSVAEEDALRKLLASDEDDEDEENADKKEEEDDNNDGDSHNKVKEDKDKDKLGKEGDKKKDRSKKKKKKQSKKKDGSKKSVNLGKDSSSDDTSDSDSMNERNEASTSQLDKKPNSAHSSRSVTPIPPASSSSFATTTATSNTTNEPNIKRKQSSSPDLSQAKKIKLDNFNTASTSSFIPGTVGGDSGVTEDAVRRYLMRKPMTTTELLQKFKSKKTNLTSEQLVNVMTQILKKINPTKQTIKNKMYLSIKAQHN